MAQLEETCGWQIESQLGQIDKKQALNSKIAESFGSRPKLGGPVYHNNIVGTLKIHLCPSHIGQVLRLPGAVSLDVLHFASIQMTLTVPEVVSTEN